VLYLIVFRYHAIVWHKENSMVTYFEMVTMDSYLKFVWNAKDNKCRLPNVKAHDCSHPHGWDGDLIGVSRQKQRETNMCDSKFNLFVSLFILSNWYRSSHRLIYKNERKKKPELLLFRYFRVLTYCGPPVKVVIIELTVT
jgi:hypothetical protein